MKSFKTFLLESKSSPASHGVLFYKDRIIVGVDHGKQVKITDKDLLKKIQDHGKEHGFHYEGDGRDAKQTLFGLDSAKDYAGGFDKEFNKSQKEFPHQHLSVLAANTAHNKQYDWITKAGGNGEHSIFDAMLKAGIGKKLDLPELTPKVLEKFLKRVNFLDRAKKTMATKEDSKKFITDMEKEGYEHKDERGEYDWKEANTEMQKVSQEGEDLRNNYILDKSKPGVFIIGAGHLDSMKRILDGRKEDYEMIGGESIE